MAVFVIDVSSSKFDVRSKVILHKFDGEFFRFVTSTTKKIKQPFEQDNNKTKKTSMTKKVTRMGLLIQVSNHTQ